MGIRNRGGSRLEQELQLKEIDGSAIRRRAKALVEYKTSFPNIADPLFLQNIRKVFLILEKGRECGLVFSHRLKGRFSKLGKYDYSILIFSKYQRAGLGRRTVSLILAIDKNAIFLVPENNKISQALFSSILELFSECFGRVLIYKRKP